MKLRLIYVSTFKASTDVTELAKIHERARESNSKYDLTGMLVFGNDYFLQCLEGGREPVNRLYANILSDQRHEKVTLLDYTELHERDFGKWSMKLVLITPEKELFLRRFSITSHFDPYQLSGQSARQLMLALSE